MLEDMRKLLRAGVDALSSDHPDAGMLKSKTRDVATQFSSLAAGIVQWSVEARESFRLEVKELVARQIREMGVATEKEVQGLRARVEELERKSRARAKASRATPPSSRSSSGSRGTVSGLSRRAGSASPRRAGSGARRSS